MYCCPSPTIWPQDGVGGLMPTPMNDSAASVEDVADEQTAEAGAEGARAVDELLLLDREHLRARLPRDADPPGQPDGDENVHEAGAQRRHHEDHEEQPREGVHDVDETREEDVHPAPEVTRQRAYRHADQHDDHLGPETDEHRHPRAVDHPGEQVAAELIGSQGVLAGGRLVETAEVRLGVRERGEEVGEDRDQAEQDDDDAAGQCQAIAQQPAGAVPPETRHADPRLVDRNGDRDGGAAHLSTGCGGRGRHRGDLRRGS